MELSERQQKIFDLVQQKGRISVSSLAGTLYVSSMTIRRDLMELEQRGMLNRYRGGALSKVGEKELPISQRVYLGEAEKRELGQKAEAYLREDANIFIDSSSTCSYIIPYLKRVKGIRMITNSVKSLLIASDCHIPCVLIGGDYNEQDMCLTGTAAVRMAADVNVDVAFFSTQSYSDDGVISDSNAAQIEVRQAIMRNAGRNIFLFETGKLHKKSLYTICQADERVEVLFPDSAKKSESH